MAIGDFGPAEGDLGEGKQAFGLTKEIFRIGLFTRSNGNKLQTVLLLRIVIYFNKVSFRDKTYQDFNK